MQKERIEKLLRDVKSAKISLGKALDMLKTFPYDDMGFAKFDTHRVLRKGFPEVIFCQGKTKKQVQLIFKRCANDSLLMATRADKQTFKAVKLVRRDAEYFDKARIIIAGKRYKKKGKPIAIATAGTADIPVAEEAAVTAEAMGNLVDRIYDIGVAGIHRMFMNKDKFINANVVIVVAGMEGALVSVIGGLVRRPVIAVPTSVGYGASFEGIAPLLTMLNCCAPGVCVVNIDNGFGAGYLSSLINEK